MNRAWRVGRAMAVVMMGVCGLMACAGLPTAFQAEDAASQNWDHDPSATEGDASASPARSPARLPESARPVAYQLLLTVDPESERFSGTATIALELAEADDRIALHGLALTLSRAEAVLPDGTRLPGDWQETSATGRAELVFPETLPAGPLSLEIDYEAPFNTQGQGLFRSEHGGVHYAYTQLQAIDARRVFPGFDEPGFKTPFELTLIVPEGDEAIANMPVAEATTLDDGRRRLRFVPTPPLPTYLLAFAVGPFELVDGPVIKARGVRKSPVALRGIAPRGEGARMAFALKHAPALIDQLERYFGIAYPYPKLDLLAVPGFNIGAMENPGAITFKDADILLDANASFAQRRNFLATAAHELAHQWFGDYVTLDWWDDLWLNEAFATWLGNKVAQTAFPDYDFALDTELGARYAMSLDGRGRQRPIRQDIARDEDILNAFDDITYLKGAGVLAMFEQFLGQKAFREGVRAYLKAHADGSARAEDFIAALTEAGREPRLATAFDSFLRRGGLPELTLESSCAEEGARLLLRQQRYRPVGARYPGSAGWTVPLCASIDADGYRAQRCSLVAGERSSVALTQCPEAVMPNADGAGYYRWNLPAAGWDVLWTRFARLPAGEALDVVGNLSAAWHAGHLSQGEYVRALDTVIPRAPLAALPLTFGDIDLMLSQSVPEEERDAVTARLADLFRTRLAALGWEPSDTEPGAHRLARRELAQFLALDLAQPEELARLAEWGRAYLGVGGDGQWHPEAVPTDLAGLAMAAALRSDGEPLREQLTSLLAGTEDPVLRARALAALGLSATPESTAPILALGATDAVRSHERLELLETVTLRPDTAEAGLRWLHDAGPEFVPNVPEALRPAIPGLFTLVCSRRGREELAGFLKANAALLPGAEQPGAAALESIELCRALVDKQGPLRLD